MSSDAAHKSSWQTFEVIFGIPFLVALALQWLIPLSLPRGSFVPLLVAAGALLIVLGIVLVVLSRREFARYGQRTDPGHPTRELITTGIFSISRNPLYLGGVCLLAGVSLVFNLPWALIFLLPSLFACHYILVAPEEKYLALVFGERYRLYSAAVSRWLGRKKPS